MLICYSNGGGPVASYRFSADEWQLYDTHRNRL